jgi:hypothetical protein
MSSSPAEHVPTILCSLHCQTDIHGPTSCLATKTACSFVVVYCIAFLLCETHFLAPESSRQPKAEGTYYFVIEAAPWLD